MTSTPRMFHCGELMQSIDIELPGARGQQTDFTCAICGQKEREIRNSLGNLIRWMNLSAKQRHQQGLARAESGA